jgi:hypothetical protein
MKLPERIYVDDALVLALSKCHMKQVLAALIKAIFVIMGKPNTRVRQCPLALDKWAELIVAPRQRMLGLLIDTNTLTVGIPSDYIKEVLNLINSTWHSHRHCFTVGEAQRPTGKLGHLAEGAQWVFHLLTHLYASIAYALAKNKRLLADSSPKFRSICLFLRTDNFPCTAKDQVKHVNHVMKRAAKMVHHAKFEFDINKMMCQEIDFFREKLLPNSDISGKLPLPISYRGCQRSHPLVIVASKEQEHTPSRLATGGTSLFPRRLCSPPSSTKRTIVMVASSQLTSSSLSPSS